MYIKEVVSEMESKHQMSLQANKIMLLLFDKYLLKGEVPDNLLSHLTLYFLTKFHKSLLSFRMLVISGFEEDARIILRTLIESAIVLAYISKKPEKRVERFIKYDYVIRYRLMEVMKQHYDESDIKLEQSNQIEEYFQSISDEYKNKSQWSDKSIFEMAKEVGMTYWYEAVYRFDSSYVHSNISAAKGFMLEGKDELLLAVGPQVFEATELLSKSCEISRIILFIGIENFKYDTSKVIESWNEALDLIKQEISLVTQGRE